MNATPRWLVREAVLGVDRSAFTASSTRGAQVSKGLHETHQFSLGGGVDADGHILEPPDLWEKYIDREFRDRAMRVAFDENGLEQLLVDGKPSELSPPGVLCLLGAMGEQDPMSIVIDPERTYATEAPFGSMDPNERLKVLDAENIDAVVLHATLGLMWEGETLDPALGQAHSRAYNRWICDFCADSPRLIASAHLSLSDPAAAARELERAVNDGAKACYVAPFTHDARPLGHPDNDPVFAAAQDLDVPLGIHPMLEPQWTKGTRIGQWSSVKQMSMLSLVMAPDGVRHQFATLFDFGVFDRFPSLKVLVLESGGGWVGYYLDRMDGMYSHTPIGKAVPLKQKPSDYFRERVWISCDPDERMIPALAARYGADRFMWASDFPHIDHTPDYINDLNDLVSLFPPEDRASFAGGNARMLYKIDPAAKANTP